MKKLFFSLFAFASLSLSAQVNSVVVYKTDGSRVAFYSNDVDSVALENSDSIPVSWYEKNTMYVDNEYKVPSYFESMLKQKEAKVRKAIESAGPDHAGFVFITDTHWENNAKNSPALVKHIIDNTPLNNCIFGGDANNAGNLTIGPEFQNAFRFLGPRFYCVFGNHEGYGGLSEAQIYSYLQSQMGENNFHYGSYYCFYYDVSGEKTRYIGIDTGRWQGIPASSAEFIVDALKTTPADWHIVFASHIWQDATQDESTAFIPGWLDPITSIFDHYNARSTGSGVFGGQRISYNFTTCKGHIEFCIGGHNHFDCSTYTKGGILMYQQDTDGMQLYGKLNGCDVCQVGTVSEQCVSAVVADWKKHKLYVYRVGRGHDWEFDLK